MRYLYLNKLYNILRKKDQLRITHNASKNIRTKLIKMIILK